MKYIGCITFVLLFTIFTSKSQVNNVIDTSYTIHSAWKKLKKEYPNVVIAKTRETDNLVSKLDQVYACRGQRLLSLDLWLPNRELNTSKALVIMVHGGGWRSGNKSMLAPIAKKIAKGGYVVASLEYRLSHEAIYPAAINDIKDAIGYLRQNKKTYGIDTSKIVILGCSAGATLASLVAVSENNNNKYLSRIKALINIDGVVDLTDPNESGKDNCPDKPSAAAMFLGCTYQERPKLWQEASAIMHVGVNSPEALFINSTVPRFHAGRDKFISVLMKNKIYHEVHTIEDSPHTFWLFDPWFEKTSMYIIDFLNRRL